MNEFNYVPVVNTHTIRALMKGMEWKGKDLAFFTKDSMINSKHFLVNPYHCKNEWDTEKFKVKKDNVIFADSGGLQEITFGSNNAKNPSFIKEIFRWQQKYCDIGFSFDVIPYKPGTWEFLKNKFEECAYQSKEKIEQVLPLKNSNFKFYGIIHGRQYSDYKKWFDIINNDKIDGYCLKEDTFNQIKNAEVGIFALENLDTNIHFLGQGNASRTIVPIYLSNYFGKKITFDSSSYDVGAQYRNFFLPHNPSQKIRLMNDSKIDFGGKWFCDCAVCKHFDLDEIKNMIKQNNPLLGEIISLHNLQLNIKTFNYLKRIKHDKERLINWAKKNIFKRQS